MERVPSNTAAIAFSLLIQDGDPMLRGFSRKRCEAWKAGIFVLIPHRTILNLL
jgi:hypothetical protein